MTETLGPQHGDSTSNNIIKWAIMLLIKNKAFMKIQPTNTNRSGITLSPFWGMSVSYERGITLSLTN